MKHTTELNQIEITRIEAQTKCIVRTCYNTYCKGVKIHFLEWKYFIGKEKMKRIGT